MSESSQCEHGYVYGCPYGCGSRGYTGRHSMSENKTGQQYTSPEGGWPEWYRETWDLLLHKSFCSLDEELMRERQADTAASNAPVGEREVRTVRTD